VAKVTEASGSPPSGRPGTFARVYDWLLFLHVVAAFAVVAGVAAYGVVAFSDGLAVRRALVPPARALWNGGALGVLVFGAWLAIDVDGYELWDGWIIAAFVLWLVAGAIGGRLERGLRGGDETVNARMLVALMALVTTLLLLDMIFKPGA
jgi:hypothetical protein